MSYIVDIRRERELFVSVANLTVSREIVRDKASLSLLQYFTCKNRKKGNGDSSYLELEQFSGEGQFSVSVQQAPAAQSSVEAAGSSDDVASIAVRTETLVSPHAYDASSNPSWNDVGNNKEDITKGTQLQVSSYETTLSIR